MRLEARAFRRRRHGGAAHDARRLRWAVHALSRELSLVTSRPDFTHAINDGATGYRPKVACNEGSGLEVHQGAPAANVSLWTSTFALTVH
jgi:hypothetical protein